MAAPFNSFEAQKLSREGGRDRRAQTMGMTGSSPPMGPLPRRSWWITWGDVGGREAARVSHLPNRRAPAPSTQK
jgi:hypothetical protein